MGVGIDGHSHGDDFLSVLIDQTIAQFVEEGDRCIGFLRGPSGWQLRDFHVHFDCLLVERADDLMLVRNKLRFCNAVYYHLGRLDLYPYEVNKRCLPT